MSTYGAGMVKKTMTELLQEEKEKLLAEINEKVNRKKSYLKADEPETGFQNFKRK